MIDAPPQSTHAQRKREEREALRAARFIIWIDYGPEGWAARTFASQTEVVEAIQLGISEPFIVTSGALGLAISS